MSLSSQKEIENAEFYFKTNQTQLSKKILIDLIYKKNANTKCYELLAYIYGNEGNYKEAKKLLTIACSYTDVTAEAHFYLGKILSEFGDYDTAIKHFEQSIYIGGEYFEGFFELGLAFANLNKNSTAENYFRKALSIFPNHIDTLFNIAKLHHDNLNNTEVGIKLYENVLEINESHVPSLIGLGELYEKIQQFDSAIFSYKKALSFSPFNKNAWLNLGRLLSRSNQIDDGLKLLDKLFNYPKNTDFFYIKGTFLLSKKNFSDALENYEAAIKSDSNNYEAWENKSFAQFSLGLYNNAFISIDKALSLNPKSARAWQYKADFYTENGNYELAINSYKVAIELDSSIPLLISSYLNVSLRCMKWDDTDFFYQKVKSNYDQFLDPITLLYFCDDPNFIYENNKKYTNSIFKKIGSTFVEKKFRDGKIRLAYFSPDFKMHPVSFLMKDIFRFHNRDQFEIYGFYINNKGCDNLTEKIRDLFDFFIDITELSDQESIDLIRSFGIDIAFDLTGHTKNARTNIFLNRIANIQVNFIGYPNTMGNDMYDYIIADKYLICQSEKRFISENIIYLPNCFQPNSFRQFNTPEMDAHSCNFTNAPFIYCCFNFNSKINRNILHSWIEILESTHNSILLLYVESCARNNLINEIKRINSSILGRFIFFDRSDYETYLSRFKNADLFLDTYPFGGGTTTSDALLSGLPVLTLAGNSFHNRMSKSLLHNLGLDELITYSFEAYKENAIRLCLDSAYYESIKERLQLNLLKSQIFDPVIYTKELESRLIETIKTHIY